MQTLHGDVSNTRRLELLINVLKIQPRLLKHALR